MRESSTEPSAPLRDNLRLHPDADHEMMGQPCAANADCSDLGNFFISLCIPKLAREPSLLHRSVHRYERLRERLDLPSGREPRQPDRLRSACVRGR